MQQNPSTPLPTNITLQDLIDAGHIDPNYTPPLPPLDESDIDLLETKTANAWIEDAKLQPIPLMLFSEFWYEREVTFLFSSTNLGKSILAVQIADSISRGVAIPGFKLEAHAQKVLYCDFEISSKQFEKRYSINWAAHYNFSPNFFRSVIKTRNLSKSTLPREVVIKEQIKKELLKYDIKVLIIDNLTYLSSKTDKGDVATALMHELNNLAAELNLSVLVLAHTPKRPLSDPLDIGSLKGSSYLSDLCDAAFAINRSACDKNMRYIKQVKQRSCDETYGADNVCVVNLDKPENMLRFELINHTPEYLHLRRATEEEKTATDSEIIDMHKGGLSLRQIGSKLGINHMAVKKVVDKYKAENNL